MNFELRQQFRIEAARFLPKLPKEHPCSRTHGHSFLITLVMNAPLNTQLGWVRDYHEIEHLWNECIRAHLDHRLLNDVEGLKNPTSEYISKWIFDKISKLIPEITQVIVSETPNTECRYPANK